MMTRGRNLATTILLAATLLLVGSRASEAQDDTPPPRMLLNLDLFTAPSAGSNPPGTNPDRGDSTIEQLRALSAMGYLSSDGPLPPDVDDDSNAPPTSFVPNPQRAPQ
jgi:hypothetical protein